MDIKIAVEEAKFELTRGRVVSKIKKESLRLIVETGRDQFNQITRLQDQLEQSNKSLARYRRKERDAHIDSRDYMSLLAGVLSQIGDTKIPYGIMEDPTNDFEMVKDVRTREYLFRPIIVERL